MVAAEKTGHLTTTVNWSDRRRWWLESAGWKRSFLASPAIDEVDVESLYLSGSDLFFKSENRRDGMRVRSQRVTERKERQKVERARARAREIL